MNTNTNQKRLFRQSTQFRNNIIFTWQCKKLFLHTCCHMSKQLTMRFQKPKESCCQLLSRNTGNTQQHEWRQHIKSKFQRTNHHQNMCMTFYLVTMLQNDEMPVTWILAAPGQYPATRVPVHEVVTMHSPFPAGGLHGLFGVEIWIAYLDKILRTTQKAWWYVHTYSQQTVGNISKNV